MRLWDAVPFQEAWHDAHLTSLSFGLLFRQKASSSSSKKARGEHSALARPCLLDLECVLLRQVVVRQGCKLENRFTRPTLIWSPPVPYYKDTCVVYTSSETSPLPIDQLAALLTIHLIMCCTMPAISFTCSSSCKPKCIAL